MNAVGHHGKGCASSLVVLRTSTSFWECGTWVCLAVLSVDAMPRSYGCLCEERTLWDKSRKVERACEGLYRSSWG
jgi:hypothetical protein